MFHRLYIGVTAIGMATVASQAGAAPAAIVPPFATPAVSDQLLGETSGTASPYAPLSRIGLGKLADVQARDDVRLFGSIAGLQMDAWWGTVGAELIATAVRDR